MGLALGSGVGLPLINEPNHLAHLVDGDDVGMAQFGRGLRLAAEAMGKGGLPGEMRGQHFECYHAVEVGIAGFVDDGKATMADFLDDFVFVDLLHRLIARGSPSKRKIQLRR